MGSIKSLQQEANEFYGIDPAAERARVEEDYERHAPIHEGVLVARDSAPMGNRSYEFTGSWFDDAQES